MENSSILGFFMVTLFEPSTKPMASEVNSCVWRRTVVPSELLINPTVERKKESKSPD